MLSKEQKIRLGIYQNIRKNVYGKSWLCMAESCSKTSINSHLLQKNGILNNLVENGHLVQLKPGDVFKIEDSGFATFKRVGIDQVISYPLFCDEHDTTIFRSIEVGECDFMAHTSQLLLSYRALCAELRKKDRDKEVHKRLLDAKSLQHLEAFRTQIQNSSRGIEQGIADLSFFKREFELELEGEAGRFIFFTGTYPLVKLSISAVFSYNEGINLRSWPTNRPLPTIFVNVFPKEGILYVIMGYYIDCSTEGVQRYIEKWKGRQGHNVTGLLSDLVTRVETWTMANSLYQTIPKKDTDKYLRYFVDSMGVTSKPSFDVNLFRQV